MSAVASQKIFSSLASSIKGPKNKANQQLDDTELMLNSIKNEIDMREFANEEFMMPSSPNSEKDVPTAATRNKGNAETHQAINKKEVKP